MLLYRPESVCHKNGVALTFMSNSLKSILGDTFVKDLHKKVMKGTRSKTTDAHVALQTNLEVERLREEKEREKAQRVALQAQLDALQQRFEQIGLNPGASV